MKKIYKILAIELAIIIILLTYKNMELWAIPCLIMYIVCLYKGNREEK